MPTKGRTPCGSSGGSSHNHATKQQSIYDFFSQPVTTTQQPYVGRKLRRKTRRSLEASAKSTHFRNTATRMKPVDPKTSLTYRRHDNSNKHDVNDLVAGNKHQVTHSPGHNLVKTILNSTSTTKTTADEDEFLPKRIDYDSSSDGTSTNSSSTRRHQKLRPSDVSITCSSQRSTEPDIEPTSVHTPVRCELLRSASQSSFQTPLQPQSLRHYHLSQQQPQAPFSGLSTSSQDDLDFLTPRDQPVIPLSNPNTPSPLKKRARLESDVELIPEEPVQNLTQDMTHMDVRQVKRGPPSFFSSQSSMDVYGSSPLRKKMLMSLCVPSENDRREHTTSLLSAESYVNPFAPEPTTESGKKKKISRRKRRSFPSTWVGEQTGSPLAKYLSDFSELGLIGSGSFSKVYKCIKKIDGWEYAVKKNKRHFRGKADTERALREVQALAALSSSNHVVRYFDAWIEEDLLYIQLERLDGCSLDSFVNKYAPHKVPEEVLCKLLCHIAQALYDMHSKKMVHMDVKLQNVLVGPGEVYKLGDLGTVAHLDGSMEITEGDNRYLSRELLEGNRNNLRAGDIFALGATIYELALGTTLASGGEEWQQIRDGDLVMFRQYSNSLQHLIASMMHPDALQRPLAEDILQHEVVFPFR